VKNWAKPNLPAEDKALLKHNILNCIIHNLQDDLIKVQYEEIVKQIAMEDFPAKWPEILPQITEALSQQSNYA
jgi:hypothetical protein